MENQSELIELMKLWQQTDPTIYKTNIKNICCEKNISIKQIQNTLNISYNLARSYRNTSHKSRIEFLTALRLAELLEVDIKKFLENN